MIGAFAGVIALALAHGSTSEGGAALSGRTVANRTGPIAVPIQSAALMPAPTFGARAATAQAPAPAKFAAHEAGPRATDSDVHAGAVFSPTLGRDYPYVVYRPAAIHAAGRRLPVVYLLHGAGGNQFSWALHGGIQQTADRLIEEGRIPPVLIVMPGCVGCWWIDGHREKAETAFWRDLEPHIQAHYPVLQERAGRFVAGLSAGGFGAVRMALRYPDRFAAAGALSPAVYADRPPPVSSARLQHAFKAPTGAFDLALWKARNYPSQIATYREQPHRVAMFIASGDSDTYGCAYEAAKLFSALFEHQPDDAELRIVDGTHSWAVWRATVAEALVYMLRHAPRRVDVVARRANRGEQASARPTVDLP